MSHLLAIDQGTTSSRAIVFTHNFDIAAVAKEEFPQHYPQSGWVEHDPEDLWQSVVRTMRAAFHSAATSTRNPAGIGITQSARDDAPLGSQDRQTASPRSRVAGPKDERSLRAADGRGAREARSRENRAFVRSLFHRHETYLAARHHSGRPRAGVAPAPAEFTVQWKLDETYTPKLSGSERDGRYARWRKAVEATLAYGR